jgi:hypothetical protein
VFRQVTRSQTNSRSYTLLERLQTGTSDTTEVEDDDFEDEEPSVEPENSNEAVDRNERGGQKVAFAIDPQIDINFHALLDMISEETVEDHIQPLAAHELAANHKITIDEAFNDW